ncbi:MopE-related protein [Myxococcus sp. Y35]|uniref:MopE-related protein n=1 Tax=Pseudomyxococcus flavus TaxID=3115648 RepID=UPI003CF98C29
MALTSVSGCRKQEDPPEAGALRVLVSYATFRPACLTLTVTDEQDPSRTESTDVRVDPEARSDIRTVAILGREGWSRNLRLVASANERSCNGPVVARQEVTAQVPEVGTADVQLALRALDLDDDGYVDAEGQYPGSDCDDADPAIHPGATEVCDGVDNNCVNGEADAPGGATYYLDADGDGFGDPLALPNLSCNPPPGYVQEGGDCNDQDANVFPRSEELVCDGRDDNCDGAIDNAPFDVGAVCRTAQNCDGNKQCTADQASTECVSALVPQEWFVDEDGDGHAGTSAGFWCADPPVGAVAENTDCDESSRFASSTATEVCDRLDNDCDGEVDEGLTGCDPGAWTVAAGTPPSAVWRAVAPYGANKGWLAGDGGQVAHVDGDTLSLVASCAGAWSSAWTTSTGRVFLGSSAGVLTTRLPTDTGACAPVQGPGEAGLNGMVGFEDGGRVTLFAVDSAGRIIRWVYEEGAPTQAEPELIVQVFDNLRSINGTSPETLLAVGATNVSGVNQPVIWRAPAPGSTEWTREDLGTLPSGGFLYDIDVLSPTRAVAVGDSGLLLERSGTTWSVKPQLTLPSNLTADIRRVVAFGSKAVYAVSSGTDDIHFFNGETWTIASTPPSTIFGLEGTGPTDLWAAGSDGVLVRWRP